MGRQALPQLCAALSEVIVLVTVMVAALLTGPLQLLEDASHSTCYILAAALISIVAAPAREGVVQ